MFRRFRQVAGNRGSALSADRAGGPSSGIDIRPRLAQPFRYELRDPRPAERERVESLVRGQFAPAALFDPLPIGVPPPWSDNPTGNRSWDFHRHSWEWMEPLVLAADDTVARELVIRIIASWLEAEAGGSGGSPFWWNDHAAAIRARMLGFVWEAFATGGHLDGTLAAMLIDAVERHCRFLVDDANHPPRSNHGLEMDVSLMVLGRMFPELSDAADWVEVGERRMGEYTAENFSSIGFHLEQSPAYHSFVLTRLAGVVEFYLANGLEPPEMLTDTVQRAAAAWHHLIRSDDSIPPMGDSPEYPKPKQWQLRFRQLTGGDPPLPTADSIPNPRADSSTYLVDEDAGYAVLSGGSWGLHLVMRVAAFDSPHRHFDALTFVLRAGGRDWITDSGYHSYENVPERAHVVSSRAHNVVLVDDADFLLNDVSVLMRRRDECLDVLAAEHLLPAARHVRTLTVDHAEQSVIIDDQVASTDGADHHYVQLLHTHPDMQVSPIGDGTVEIVAPDGDRMIVTQDLECRIELIRGTSEEGRLDGWYSADYGDWRPAWVIRSVSVRPSARQSFRTSLRYVARASSAAEETEPS